MHSAWVRRLLPAGAVGAVLALSALAPNSGVASLGDLTGSGYIHNCGEAHEAVGYVQVHGGKHNKPCPEADDKNGKSDTALADAARSGHSNIAGGAAGTSHGQPGSKTQDVVVTTDQSQKGNKASKNRGHGHHFGLNRE
jgi:hypothetical protein